MNIRHLVAYAAMSSALAFTSLSGADAATLSGDLTFGAGGQVSWNGSDLSTATSLSIADDPSFPGTNGYIDNTTGDFANFDGAGLDLTADNLAIASLDLTNVAGALTNLSNFTIVDLVSGDSLTFQGYNTISGLTSTVAYNQLGQYLDIVIYGTLSSTLWDTTDAELEINVGVNGNASGSITAPVGGLAGGHSVVPEPASITLLGGGGIAAFLVRRRKVKGGNV